MIIDRFSITGYRGFKDKKSIVLNPNMNVIFGENGAGKSSLLTAMMISLSWLPARIRSISTNGSFIEQGDINMQMSSSELHVTCRTEENESISWSLHKTKKGYPSNTKSDFSELNIYAKGLQSRIANSREQCSLPLVGYYPVTRAGISFPSRIKTRHQFDLTSVLANDQIWNADYKAFYEWFRDQESIENKGKLANGHDFLDRSLEAVRKAIYTFIPSFSRIHFNFTTPKGLVVDKEGYGELRIEQLSGGEQCLLAMIGDLARKLAIANPTLENPLAGNGIICIDEVDLHLHPTWQYAITKNLQNTFPNCQFILSTHSPCVISHAKPSEVSFLSVEHGTITISQSVNTYGKDAKSIYGDFMQLNTIRPKEVNTEIEAIYKLMETDLRLAEKKLNNLQRKVIDDTELEKMQLIIDRRRALGV